MEDLIRLCAFFVVVLSLSFPAHAYLDPVTGSLIVQGFIALLAAVIAGVKSVRLKLTELVARLFSRR